MIVRNYKNKSLNSNRTEVLFRGDTMANNPSPKADIVFTSPKLQTAYEKLKKIVDEKQIDIMKLFL